MRALILFAALTLTAACHTARSARQAPNTSMAVIAYYHGSADAVDKIRPEQLTHIIFSFLHLRGDELAVDNTADSLTIRRLVALKQRAPGLKVLLSLGGWGGCETCPRVFSTDAGRQRFARSVLLLLHRYQADGIDLDWEYPVIEGYPGHPYGPEDKANFTKLVETLRQTLGQRYVISFAAGGFQRFFDQSVEWNKVMPRLDFVNVMTYDLVSGFSTQTGHHTPLYATPDQQASVDFSVRYLQSLGVPKQKIVIGAAFYARVWENVPDINHGLFQPGKFKAFVQYRDFETRLSAQNGFVFYRDSLARAPYAYNIKAKEFATFDDRQSIGEKTVYARAQGLGGIMFWQLGGDTDTPGLLQAIHDAQRR